MLQRNCGFAFLHGLLIVICVVFGPHPAGGQPAPESGYVVVFEAERPLKPEVQARLPASTSMLVFPGPSVGTEPEDWMSRVRDLEVTSMSGHPVPITAVAPGRWRVDQAPEESLRVSYRVDLGFARDDAWPAGNEHAAWSDGHSLYAMGEALFLAGDVEGPAEVRFRLPPGWYSSTPWRPTSARDTYVAPSTDSLLDNCIALGKYGMVELEAGGFHYTLALLGRAAEARDSAAAAVERQLHAYVELFGGAPAAPYLQVMFVSDEEDGEAHLNSSGFRTSLPPSRSNRILWLNTLSHELFHRWLSSKTLIAPEDYASSQWFSEGFTEYYSNLTLLRNGSFSRDDFLRKMEKNLGLYLYYGWSPAFEATLARAGENKGLNRLAVYNGGWTAAFCLDGLIRSETKNRRSLDDFMREMYRRYGSSGTRYDVADLPAVVESSTGVDVRSFFDRHVFGAGLMPVEECLSRAGFLAGIKGYAGEVYVWPDETATGLREHVRRRMTTLSP